VRKFAKKSQRDKASEGRFIPLFEERVLKMKKRLGLLLMMVILLAMGGNPGKVQAAQTARPVVALGADLTADQRATVLDYMGLTEDDLANCTVITVTNEMEKEYLGDYLDASVIGTRALSSVMLTKGEEGSGVLVTTKNINYCTTGMYRNALLTAGLEDTSVLVVGPSPISGTAALIGAVKAYEEMAQVSVADSTLDTALNELIVTGDIAEDNANSEEVEELIAFIKGKLAAGELDSDEDIEKAITEGEEKFNVTLTDSEKQQIVSLMDKIQKLGLDPEKLLEQAEDLYKKYGMDIVNHTEDAIKESVASSISGYFNGVVEQVKSFFTRLFAK
jgi:uncharacterized protein YpuA (DUF1002 family)